MEKTQLLDLYRNMLTIRRFEERIATEFIKGNALGYIHCSIGQEAIPTGVCAHLRKDDRIVSSHRGHGHTISKGADVRPMMAEVYGRKTGYCKGKGGSMHIADFKIGMLGANGIVGAGLPISLGAALAAQLERKGGVAVVFFGDGATQEGEFHEVMSMASLWKLPLLFVCENNKWASGIPDYVGLPVKDIHKKTVAYNMEGYVVDGNDVLAVHEKAGELIERIRREGAPILLECKTYRWHPHFESMPDPRPVQEIQDWIPKCPIAAYERRLKAEGVADDSDLSAINDAVMAKIEDAVKFAEDSPFPDPEDALEDVYSD